MPKALPRPATLWLAALIFATLHPLTSAADDTVVPLSSLGEHKSASSTSQQLFKLHAAAVILGLGGSAGLGIGYEFSPSDWTAIGLNLGIGGGFGGEFSSGTVLGLDAMFFFKTPGANQFILGLGGAVNYFPEGECWSTPLLDRDKDCSVAIAPAFNLSYRYQETRDSMFFEIGLASHSALAQGIKISTGFAF